MRQSEQIDKIAPALLRVQLKVEPLTKDAQNPHLKNRYTTLNLMVEYVVPILNEEKITLVQGGAPAAPGMMGVETMLLHESGQWISHTVELPLSPSLTRDGREIPPNGQTSGSLMSYGRRYGLGAALSMISEEDDDAESAVRSDREIAQRSGAKAGERPAPATPARTLNEESCPKCGGRTWDNRATKKNPRQPDFKCRDKSCDGVIWPPRPSEQYEPEYV